MKPIMILGDTGLLGQALVKQGKNRNLEIRGASRRSSDLAINALDNKLLQRVLDEVRPGTVINTAGLASVDKCESSPDQAWASNALLPALLADACAERKIRLIHISTDHYFTGDGRVRHDEAAPVKLVNEYARSKYAGESMALACPGALVVRTNIVGFRDWKGEPTFVEWLLQSLLDEAPIELYTDVWASSLAVGQFADALFNLLECNATATGVLNLASSEGASKREFAEALAAACSLSTRACRPGSVHNLQGVRRANSLVLDVSRAESLLGERLPGLTAVAQRLAVEYRERNSRSEMA